MYSRPPDPELAYHEATHAVICIELGAPFEYVMIDKVGDMEGHMYAGEKFDEIAKRIAINPISEEETELMIKYIKCLYAAPMAQGLFRGGYGWWYYTSDGNDITNAKAILKGLYKHLPDDSVFQINLYIKHETMLLVNDDVIRRKTQALSEQLIIKRRIEYSDCLAIVSGIGI